MTAQIANFPQAPHNRTIAYSGILALPEIRPLSPLAICGKALEYQMSRATPSSAATLGRVYAILECPISARDSDLDAHYPKLRDELESYVQAHEIGEDRSERESGRVEFALYSRLAGRHEPFATMDAEAFVDLLMQVHRRLGIGINALRDGPVGLRPDAHGNRVLFPHPSLCGGLLTSLHEFLNSNVRDYPALCATIAFAGIVHAHPFNDGNGRTARTIFNLILADRIGTRHFVPIRAISRRRPGFALRLKRALHGGDWLSLQAWFGDAARLSRDLQALHGRLDTTPSQRRG